MLHRRKMNHRGYHRGPSLIPAVSEVKQRVVSAKILRVKQIQNQLAEAHMRINVRKFSFKKFFVLNFKLFLDFIRRS
jgi:hypothetical protein